jgi:hypothetical protein
VEKKGFDLLLSASAVVGQDPRTADLGIAGAGSVDPVDADGLAALRARPADGGRRRAIGPAGRDRVLQFHWTSIADRYRPVHATGPITGRAGDPTTARALGDLGGPTG